MDDSRYEFIHFVKKKLNSDFYWDWNSTNGRSSLYRPDFIFISSQPEGLASYFLPL